jgi:hypothetical protein
MRNFFSRTQPTPQPQNGATANNESTTTNQNQLPLRKLITLTSNAPTQMNTTISNLPPATKDALIALCDEHIYKEAVVIAREKLGITVSPSALCKLYTTSRLDEDDAALAEFAAKSERRESKTNPEIARRAIRNLSLDQAHLRLLEISSRPVLDVAEVRVVCQSITRFAAAELAARRVALGERRETRLAKQSAEKLEPARPAPKVCTQEDLVTYTRALLGKQITLT